MIPATEAAPTVRAAAPPIWDAAFGPELTELTGEDDAVESVDLPFSFPFEGIDYTTVWVGTDGCLQLETLGLDGAIGYDLWASFQALYADDDGIGRPEPVICPFNTDLDLSERGTVHFEKRKNRVTFTWNEVGTREEPAHLSTFQVQLRADGTIVFGYDGVLDDEGESPLGSLSEGIVVGISLGDRTFPKPEENPFDLGSGLLARAGDTAYERWCRDEADTCGETGRPGEDYAGPTNAAFDLDQKNVVFNPAPGGGFVVRHEVSSEPPTADLAVTQSVNRTLADNDDLVRYVVNVV